MLSLFTPSVDREFIMRIVIIIIREHWHYITERACEVTNNSLFKLKAIYKNKKGV